MRFSTNLNGRNYTFRVKTPDRPTGRRWRRASVCLAAMAFLTCAAWPGQQAPSPGSDQPPLTSKANHLPGVDQKKQTRGQQVEKQNLGAAHGEQKNQIADDSAKLLKLAIDLKIEVDEAGLDTLSLTIIRKADQIEKLARSVREKMKVTIGPGS